MSGMTVLISEVFDIQAFWRVISVIGSNFNSNKMNGIEIYTDEFDDQNLAIICQKSNFLTNDQIGLFIGKMAINELEIIDWKACTNGSRGCKLNIVHHRANKNSFKISNSKFSENKDTGLQIDDCGVNISNTHCNNNKKYGLSINGTFRPSNVPVEINEFIMNWPMDTTLNKVSCINNQIHGLSIKSYWKGGISITNWAMNKNSEDGILLYNPAGKTGRVEASNKSEINLKRVAKKLPATPSNPSRDMIIDQGHSISNEERVLPGFWMINSTKILRNRKCGLTSKNTYVDIGNVTITG